MDDNTKNLVLSLCDGNPGALHVLMKLASDDESGIRAMSILDEADIRGSNIWVLYKDMYGYEIPTMINRLLTVEGNPGAIADLKVQIQRNA